MHARRHTPTRRPVGVIMAVALIGMSQAAAAQTPTGGAANQRALDFKYRLEREADRLALGWKVDCTKLARSGEQIACLQRSLNRLRRITERLLKHQERQRKPRLQPLNSLQRGTNG